MLANMGISLKQLYPEHTSYQPEKFDISELEVFKSQINTKMNFIIDKLATP